MFERTLRLAPRPQRAVATGGKATILCVAACLAVSSLAPACGQEPGTTDGAGEVGTVHLARHVAERERFIRDLESDQAVLRDELAAASPAGAFVDYFGLQVIARDEERQHDAVLTEFATAGAAGDLAAARASSDKLQKLEELQITTGAAERTQLLRLPTACREYDLKRKSILQRLTAIDGAMAPIKAEVATLRMALAEIRSRERAQELVDQFQNMIRPALKVRSRAPGGGGGTQ
jgi:hypothetical protein